MPPFLQPLIPAAPDPLKPVRESDPEPSSRERLRRLLVSRSVRSGDFQLSSGRRSPYYIDCRMTTLHAQGQALLGPLCLDALAAAGWAPQRVGGLTMGADPLALAIAAESWRRGAPIDAFSVRKQAKSHGGGRSIEGCFAPGDRVVIVEDVITSGGSALRAARAVRDGGGVILGVLALVDREEGGREAIQAEGLGVHSVFLVKELLPRG